MSLAAGGIECLDRDFEGNIAISEEDWIFGIEAIRINADIRQTVLTTLLDTIVGENLSQDTFFGLPPNEVD